MLNILYRSCELKGNTLQTRVHTCDAVLWLRSKSQGQVYPLNSILSFIYGRLSLQ